MGVVVRGIGNLRWTYLTPEPNPFFGETALPELPPEPLDALRTDELYDIKLDPGEIHNLIDQRPEVAAEFRAQLTAHLGNTVEGDTAQGLELAPGDIERLRALGYLE